MEGFAPEPKRQKHHDGEQIIRLEEMPLREDLDYQIMERKKAALDGILNPQAEGPHLPFSLIVPLQKLSLGLEVYGVRFLCTQLSEAAPH